MIIKQHDVLCPKSPSQTAKQEKVHFNISTYQDSGTTHMYRPIHNNWGTSMRKVAGMADVSVLNNWRIWVKICYIGTRLVASFRAYGIFFNFKSISDL